MFYLLKPETELYTGYEPPKSSSRRWRGSGAAATPASTSRCRLNTVSTPVFLSQQLASQHLFWCLNSCHLSQIGVSTLNRGLWLRLSQLQRRQLAYIEWRGETPNVCAALNSWRGSAQRSCTCWVRMGHVSEARPETGNPRQFLDNVICSHKTWGGLVLFARILCRKEL